jgi:hypothetical protein
MAKFPKRPDDLRYTLLNKKTTEWETTRVEGEGAEKLKPEGGFQQFDLTPSYDYFAALNLLRDFAVETMKLKEEWLTGEITSLSLKWTYNDKPEVQAWTYKLTIAIARSAMDDEAIKGGFGPYSFSVLEADLPTAEQGYLKIAFNEAWAYKCGKFAEGVQTDLFSFGAEPVANEIVDVKFATPATVEVREPALV